MPQFNYLFTPLKIGPVTVPNRIFMPAHGKNLNDRFGPYNITSEREAYYLAERAKGGAGLLFTEASAVHYSAGWSNQCLTAHVYLEEIVPRHKILTGMIHQYETKVFLQLAHDGMHSTGCGQDDWHVVWAPSAIPGLGASADYGPAKEMDPDDIKELIDGFAMSARYGREGGFDGIEIHSTHSYLLQQFLSPISNLRKDKYGGSLENRMRLLLEVIDAVRQEIGLAMALGIRLPGDEFAPGGLSAPEMQEVAKRIAATKKVDYLDISAGGFWTMEGSIGMMASSLVPPGYLVPLATGIKNAVKTIPILCVGRITDPAMAEKILAEGQADMVGMCRALIADPELPNKAKQGKTEEIRPCVCCSQGCINRVAKGQAITCVHNPAVGRESRLGPDTLKPAILKKRVVIVGGGPAGLKAAEIAAMRGHKVVLYEKENELGGQVRLAAKTPLRTEFGGITDYLIPRIKRLGVEVKMGREATLDVVKQEKADVVIVATGCLPMQAQFNPVQLKQENVPGIEQPHIISIFDVLNGSAKVGQNIIIVDSLRDYRTLSVADLLAGQGKQVEMIMPARSSVSETIPLADIGLLLRRLRKDRGIRMTTGAKVKSISQDKVIVSDLSGKNEREIKADTIIWATGFKANDELYFKLKGNFKEVYRIGDCVAPRLVQFAIWEGETIARTI